MEVDIKERTEEQYQSCIDCQESWLVYDCTNGLCPACQQIEEIVESIYGEKKP